MNGGSLLGVADTVKHEWLATVCAVCPLREVHLPMLAQWPVSPGTPFVVIDYNCRGYFHTQSRAAAAAAAAAASTRAGQGVRDSI